MFKITNLEYKAVISALSQHLDEEHKLQKVKNSDESEGFYILDKVELFFYLYPFRHLQVIYILKTVLH